MYTLFPLYHTNVYRIPIIPHKFVYDFHCTVQCGSTTQIYIGFQSLVCCWLDYASKLSANGACAQWFPAEASARS